MSSSVSKRSKKPKALVTKRRSKETKGLFPITRPSRFGSSNPFPSRLRIEFSSELFGSVTAGVASGSYAVGLNTLYKPWNSSTPYPNPITFATATLNPAGLTSILSATAAYRTYVVRKSTITVTLRPGSFADEIMFGVAPVLTGTSYGTMAELSQGPYSNSRPQSSQDGFQSLTSSCDPSHYFGVPESALLSEDNYGALYNAAPVDALEWQVTFATFTGTNLAGKLYYRVNIFWTVDLITQAEAGLPDTLSLTRFVSEQHQTADLKQDSKVSTTIPPTGGKFVWVTEDWLGRKGLSDSIPTTSSSKRDEDNKESKSVSTQNQLSTR